MNAEIMGVGTELLLGQIANTNARWISERLATIGVDVLHHQVVGDNLDRIVATLRVALERAQIVIVTGGLGPTGDDITRDAIAALLDVPMTRFPEIEQLLRGKFAGFGHGEMPESNLRQADVPEGARFILPIRGTAPGLIVELADGSRMYAVPGVPAEMVEMMEGTILPDLTRLAGPAALVSRTIRCAGIGESRVAEILADLFSALTNPTVAYLATSGEVKVRLTSKAASASEAEAVIAPVAEEVVRRLGDMVFTTHDESLEQAVLRLLEARGWTIACAESLTGGGVGARLTSVPGSSASFAGSAVVYTAAAKHEVLGVSEATLADAGPVSEACALEMGDGARRLYGSDLALALTGTAGPSDHGNAPPGTIWIAIIAEGVRHARGLVAPGERERVRRWAEQAGLDLVRRYLEGRNLPASDRVI